MSDPFAPFASGSFDFRTGMRVNALTEASSGLPTWVTSCHEMAHMEIASFSAVGLFQGLLCALDESRHLTGDELAAVRGLERRLAEATFQTHEGVAVYCASVHILEQEPGLLPSYVNSLTEPYQNAFRRVAPLLPKPHRLFGNTQDTYRHRTLAVLLGMYCCSTPIFDVFGSRDQLVEWQTIDFETPDERLLNIGREASKLLAVAEKISPVLARDISRIGDDAESSLLDGHDRLQVAWLEWTTRYEEAIAETGLPHDPMSLEVLLHRLDALIKAWGLPDHVETPRPRGWKDRGAFLSTQTYLPGEVTLWIRADLQQPEQVQALLSELGHASSPTLLVVRDFLPESFTTTTTLSVNDDRELTCEHEEPGEMEIIIAENAPDLLPLPHAPVPVARIKTTASQISKIAPFTAADGFFWVVDGHSYIRRQMLASLLPPLTLAQGSRMKGCDPLRGRALKKPRPARPRFFPRPKRAGSFSAWNEKRRGLMREPCAPGFAPLSSVLLPNVLLHFRSLGSLLSGMQTLRPPFDKRAYTGVIDGAVPLAFLAVAGEFMFALVPSPGEAQMFHAAVKEMGAHNWTFTEPEMQASLSIRARCAQVGIYLLNALGRDDGD